MNEYENNLITELKQMMLLQGGNYDYALVEKAFWVCVEAHKGQRRLSGEEYFHHPYSVAKILVSLGMDSESIAAGLLHDVVEDTKITSQEVEKEFGSAVNALVDGVTKLGKFIFGLGCGIITFLMRRFSAYPEGVAYAVLFMNVLTVIIDYRTRPRRYGKGGVFYGKRKANEQ